MDEERNISQSELSKRKGETALSVDDFQRAFGENFADAIDINTWSIGANLSELYPLIEEEWLKAKSDENKNQKIFREVVFSRIKEVGNVPFAGLHDDVSDVKLLLDKIHR